MFSPPVDLPLAGQRCERRGTQSSSQNRFAAQKPHRKKNNAPLRFCLSFLILNLLKAADMFVLLFSQPTNTSAQTPAAAPGPPSPPSNREKSRPLSPAGSRPGTQRCGTRTPWKESESVAEHSASGFVSTCTALSYLLSTSCFYFFTLLTSVPKTLFYR